MTPSETTTVDTATPNVDASIARAEDSAVNQLSNLNPDNPNPGLGTPSQIPDAPAGKEDTAREEPQLSKREQIAKAFRERRESAEPEEMTQNEMGEYVPPFVKRMEDETAAAAAEEAERKRLEEEAAKPAETPKTFKLKVNGNEHEVGFDELAKLAGLEPEDAKNIPTLSLVRAAQINAAADEHLTEAKQTKRSARVAAPAEDEHHVPANQQQDGPTDGFEDGDGSDPSDDDEIQKLFQRVQFGEPEDAAAALAEAVAKGVDKAVEERRYTTRFNNAVTILSKEGDEFEKKNADILADPTLASAVYNIGFVRELKKDLVELNNLKPENVDKVIGFDVRTAMQAYTTIAADGRLKTRRPN